MKEIFLTKLRDKHTSRHEFRYYAEKIAFMLASETANMLEQVAITIETPLAKTAGKKFKNNIVLVPILRSGLALLPAFLHFFEEAKVGFIGLRRDEHTAIANLYYEKLPTMFPSDDVIVLDPMIATGGSGISAVFMLKNAGVPEEKIIFVAVVAAPEGYKRLKDSFPKMRIIVPMIDEALNAQKFIVPGLGDFGDRYFGTE